MTEEKPFTPVEAKSFHRSFVKTKPNNWMTSEEPFAIDREIENRVAK
jgi:hypothetical protein